MPQMAPLNWMSLYIFFIVILLTFISQIYFSFLIHPPQKKMKKSKLLLNWKW